MKNDEAYAIIGSQPVWAVRNMVKALTMMRLLNTPEEERRLAAAKVWLRMGAGRRQAFWEARRAKVGVQ